MYFANENVLFMLDEKFMAKDRIMSHGRIISDQNWPKYVKNNP